MIYKFFETQLEKRNKKDWVNTVKNDLKEIRLENLNFDYIKTMSKLSFKKSIKEKIQNSAFDKLIRKKEMHSKVKHIKYETLEMSDYLKPGVDQVCKEEAQLIFKIRCRVTNVKVNQRGKYDDMKCRICKKKLKVFSPKYFIDTQLESREKSLLRKVAKGSNSPTEALPSTPPT